MPMLKITIADEETWNAVACEKLGTSHVVLENFRVHPFVDGVVRARTEAVDASVLRLEKGMPVRVGDRDGVVLMVDETMPMIACGEDVVIVPLKEVSYRMGNIDELSELPPSSYDIQTFEEVPYLVPVNAPATPAKTAVTLKMRGLETEDGVPAGSNKRKRTAVESYADSDGEVTESPATPRTFQRIVWERVYGKAIRSMRSHRLAKYFRDPVPWQKLGLFNYPEVITRPMDLGTVLQKFERGEYAMCRDDLHADIDLIWDNAIAFNGTTSWIVKDVIAMRAIAEAILWKAQEQYRREIHKEVKRRAVHQIPLS